MNIARPWREVNEQIIQLPPVGLSKELLEGIARHATTPQDGALLVDEEADGEHAYAVALDGSDEFASIDLLEDGTRLFAAKHLRLRRAEDIGIKQTHLIAFLRQSHSEVGRDGALPHPSFAGEDRQGVLHLRQERKALLRYDLGELHSYIPLDLDLGADVGKDRLFGSLHYGLDEGGIGLIEEK